MRGNVFVELRNVFPAQLAKDAGLNYRGLGKRFTDPSSLVK